MPCTQSDMHKQTLRWFSHHRNALLNPLPNVITAKSKLVVVYITYNLNGNHVCHMYGHTCMDILNSKHMYVHAHSVFTHLCWLYTYVHVCMHTCIATVEDFSQVLILILLPMWLLSSTLTGPGLYYTILWKMKSQTE